MSTRAQKHGLVEGRSYDDPRIKEQYAYAKEVLREELGTYLWRSYDTPSFVNKTGFIEFMLDRYLQYAVFAIEGGDTLEHYANSALYLVPDVMVPDVVRPHMADKFEQDPQYRQEFYRERVHIPRELAEASDRMVELLKRSEYLRYHASGDERKDMNDGRLRESMARKAEQRGSWGPGNGPQLGAPPGWA